MTAAARPPAGAAAGRRRRAEVSVPRRGRRAGAADTRAQILAAARRMFGNSGFEGTSLRAVARAAGVDPALIHHYFAGKEDLFAACVELPVDPARVLAGVQAVRPEERGQALLRALLRQWDSPAQPAMLALVRGAVGSQTQSTLLRHVLTCRILSRITTDLGLDPVETALRGSLVASQMVGLMVSRYVLRLEPLASAGHDELIGWFGPTVQRYLTGPLSAAEAGTGGADTAAKNSG